MNERIKELVKQMGWEEMGADLYGKSMDGCMTIHALEKFAELIVRECEKVIRAEIAVTDIDGEAERAWEMGMECGVYTIKKHFGV